MKNNNNLTLRVAETNPKFVGRGVALLDPKVMEELHLSTGDVIEIFGKKKPLLCYGLANQLIMVLV
jgi:Cell division protein 48 (CDC48), N-terminal domain